MFIRRSDVCCYVMTWAYVLGELLELMDELKKGAWKAAWAEVLDVYSCAMVALSDMYGKDLYIINNKSIAGWAVRWDWWRVWLASHGYEFKPEYMRKGSNYARAEKRKFVLGEAEKDRYDGLW